MDQFVSKSVGYLEALGEDPPAEPQGHDRQVVSYQVRSSGYPRAYVAHLRVGSLLPELPLFILPDRCISLPLETTYTAAYESLARKFREVLEAP